MTKVKFTLDRWTDRQTGWFLYTPQTSFVGGMKIVVTGYDFLRLTIHGQFCSQGLLT